MSGLVSFSFNSAGQNNRACHLARRPSGDFGRYLFCAWANHKCTAKMKKYGTKPLLIPNTPIFDGFKVREWLYEACWYFSWYWRVFIACKLWELNRGVQKAFREQNHLRLHTRLTSEKQLFICLFPHLFSTFHIEIWCWRAAWTRGKQMSLPHREEYWEEFDMISLKRTLVLRPCSHY